MDGVPAPKRPSRPSAASLSTAAFSRSHFLPYGGIRELVVEGRAREGVLGERVAEPDALGEVLHAVDCIARAAGYVAQHEGRFPHSPRGRLEFLPVGNNTGRSSEFTSFVPLVKLLESVRDEAARSTAAVVKRDDLAVVGVEHGILVGEDERRREPHDVARGHEILRVLADLLAVALDEMFVDVGHHAVGDGGGAEVEVRESGADLVEHALVVELLAGVLHLELEQHLAGVLREPADVLHKGVVGARCAEVAKSEAREVVEAIAGQQAVLLVGVVPRSGLLAGEHLVAGGLERALESAQHRKGEDELVVIGGADDVADVVGYGPDVVDVVEGLLLGSHGRPFGWLSFQPLILQLSRSSRSRIQPMV